MKAFTILTLLVPAWIATASTGCYVYSSHSLKHERCDVYARNASWRWNSEYRHEYLECTASEVYGPYPYVDRARERAIRLNVSGWCHGAGAYVVPSQSPCPVAYTYERGSCQGPSGDWIRPRERITGQPEGWLVMCPRY